MIRSQVTEDVRKLYLQVLNREPDANGLEYWVSIAQARATLDPVREGLLSSDEYKSSPGDNIAPIEHEDSTVYRGYSEKDLKILSDFANPHAKPEPGFVVDFLGGRTRTSSLWQTVRHLDGQVLGLPVPGDYHAEAIEWIGLLKSVRSAGNTYRAVELGAGMGPWIVAGGNAARLRGIHDIRLYGVEADPLHFQLLEQHLKDNNFGLNSLTVHAAVGVIAGRARFPVIENSREDWGSRPDFSQGSNGGARPDYLGRPMEKFHEIEVIPMLDVIKYEDRWDLCHIDVQGHEVDICGSCLDEINKRVVWLVIGTHSRKIDGQLIEMFFDAGWNLVHEKPSKFRFDRNSASLEAMTYVDGVQIWKNPMLL